MASSGFVVGLLVAIIACTVLYIIPDSDPRIVRLQSRVNYIASELVGLFSRESVAETENGDSIKTRMDSGKLFSVDALTAFDGSKNSPGLHIAIMGKVFDVRKGEKHYGPGGGYSFFAGRDGSKSYISGDFTDEGLTPDVEGLSPQDMVGLEDWVKFFETEYTFVGKLTGHFYDERGEPTPNLRAAQKSIKEGKRLKANEAEHQKHGGIVRDWVGVPRKLFNPGTNKWRCACINKSELHNPHLRLYDNCPPLSVSCKGDA